MALGPECFNLLFLFKLNTRMVDTSRLLKALEQQYSIKCDVCHTSFVDPESAFQHYCSISHGERV